MVKELDYRSTLQLWTEMENCKVLLETLQSFPLSHVFSVFLSDTFTCYKRKQMKKKLIKNEVSWLTTAQLTTESWAFERHSLIVNASF